MTEPQQSEDRDPPRGGQDLPGVVGRVAGLIQNSLSPGDVAALRRMRSEALFSPAFWKLVASHLEPLLPPGGPVRDEQEQRWAVVLGAMAELRGLHRPGRRLGRILGESRYAEGRVLRLLRGRGEVLPGAIRTMAHFLASKGQAVDLTDVARLVLSEGGRNEESVRRQIARDYYSQAPGA